jgi:hypothetical protein
MGIRKYAMCAAALVIFGCGKSSDKIVAGDQSEVLDVEETEGLVNISFFAGDKKFVPSGSNSEQCTHVTDLSEDDDFVFDNTAPLIEGPSFVWNSELKTYRYFFTVKEAADDCGRNNIKVRCQLWISNVPEDAIEADYSTGDMECFNGVLGVTAAQEFEQAAVNVIAHAKKGDTIHLRITATDGSTYGKSGDMISPSATAGNYAQATNSTIFNH